MEKHFKEIKKVAKLTNKELKKLTKKFEILAAQEELKKQNKRLENLAAQEEEK